MKSKVTSGRVQRNSPTKRKYMLNLGSELRLAGTRTLQVTALKSLGGLVVSTEDL